MVNNSTNVNKMSNYLSPQIIEHKVIISPIHFFRVNKGFLLFSPLPTKSMGTIGLHSVRPSVRSCEWGYVGLLVVVGLFKKSQNDMS